MYPLAHIGVALLLAKLFERRLKLKNYKLIALGSILPDLIDKPLTIVGVGSGVHHTIYDFIRILLTDRTVQAGEVVGLICILSYRKVKPI